MRQRLILIGNGMAGVRFLIDLIKSAPDQYDVTVFGEETYLGYDRIMLSLVLSGERKVDETILREAQWYKNNGIRLITGVAVTEIDRVSRAVIASDGQRYEYDKLVLATGSNPVFLDIPGRDLNGVIAFRTLDDVDVMIRAAEEKQNAVVIGGGLLGLEAAYGLQKRGMNVTVVHIHDTLMDRQLDGAAGEMLRLSLTRRGIQILLSKKTKELLGDAERQIAGVRFMDGEEIKADLVVLAIGILPRVDLAKRAGLPCRRGIVVDDYMRTSDPHIFAIGECAEHRNTTYGLVAPLYDMTKTLAQVLSKTDTKLDGVEPYEGAITSAKLKVTGIDVFSAGDHMGNPWTEDIVFQDQSLGVYKKLVLKDDKIVGIVLFGDTQDASWYMKMLTESAKVGSLRDKLIFGRQVVEALGGQPASTVASLSNDVEICGCNGVCKGTIVETIASRKLTTLEEVRAHTKASASCGSCTGQVKELLTLTAGEKAKTAPAKLTMCPCTELSPEEARELIRDGQLTTISEVMEKLGWKNPDGCQKCRPALNYYLLCEFPGIYQDHAPSRLVNERVHANIQKDGTFSVVPRMWGGLTSPAELRAIADVAEKFKVPTVKVTGGQRIDLLGVKKEDLPAVWEELNKAGMVSGHAYGKSLRTVKTCVGSEWCRFGVQDSTGLGVRLEKMTWGSWTPHKTKMAVSGCPRNCAEATIKDFGVVALDSGWELYVGGNGGIKVRVCDLLCKVETPEQVLEYSGAFLQLYRKEGRYLERTAHWVERVGLDYIKDQIVANSDNRKSLYLEFLDSQKVSQQDPWERLSQSAGVDERSDEFFPLNKCQSQIEPPTERKAADQVMAEGSL